MEQRTGGSRRPNPLALPALFLLGSAVLVFAMSIFFRVYNITVTGNGRYTAEEIIAASGIEQGDNLFFINRGMVGARITTRLPYVERAWIERSLPNRLVIHISESNAVAVVDGPESLWVIDRTCKLLAEADSTAEGELIRVSGVTPLEPAVGEILLPAEEDVPKVAYLADLLQEISELGLQNSVSSIDMTNVGNPVIRYMGRFNVRLGSNENLDYKFQLLLSAVAKMADGDRGTMDLSVDQSVHFSYD